MTHQPEQVPTDSRVAWPQLIAYGAGGIIPIALFNIAGQLMALLGNISLGLSAVWLGAIMMIPRLWDAVSDPVMGHITDNTRTRWGRRRPYLLLGGIVVALTFAAMWWVPRGEQVEAWFASESAYNWFQLTFILAGLLIFYTACTIFEIPHGALGMEMSNDYHERTRLFSAKSFLGNLFAMGTPWLIAVASLEFFCGPGGDLVDGMRYVSIAIAVLLIPMAFWWFAALKEPAFVLVQKQQKSSFWSDIRTTVSNRAFVRLVLIVFTLAMGFNFVNSFANYIKIFYLYGGDVSAASFLLGIDGTVWGVTGLLAVFPLNRLSRNWGKTTVLILAIFLMCLAQIAKVVCYDPELPYLILLPTVLLSAGMLMFFTLGASMVGDICDLDELQTGTRSEGSYYSVYWWFIKMGTALASLVMGLLLVSTDFDEKQNVNAAALSGSVEVIHADAESWMTEGADLQRRESNLKKQIMKAVDAADELEDHLAERLEQQSGNRGHAQQLADELLVVKKLLADMEGEQVRLAASPEELAEVAEQVVGHTAVLKKQSPTTLFRLRAIEISLPLLLCLVSVWLTFGYPLTESRCQEISAELQERRASQGV